MRHPFPEDWSAHRLRPVEADDLIYMADAAALAASILTMPWDPAQRLEPAGWARVPAIVAPDQAFDAAHQPVEEWHRLQGGLVWSYVNTGGFDEPVPYLPNLPLCFEDWDEAWYWSSYVNSTRQVCREVAPLVAEVLTTAAVAGDIRTMLRAVGGGAEPIDPPPLAWLIDDPLARLASCGMVHDRPGDVVSTPDHMIFFERMGFEVAMRRFLPSRWLPLLPEFAEEPSPGRGSFEKRLAELVTVMVKAIEADKEKRWTARSLKAVVDGAGLTDHTPNMFVTARGKAMKAAGITPKPGRPTQAELGLDAAH